MSRRFLARGARSGLVPGGRIGFACGARVAAVSASQARISGRRVA